MVEKEGINGSPLGHYARQLTEEERERLEKDFEVVSQFRRDKLEQEARKNWDLFYKRNSTHFFKDRHWITREFPELLTELQNDGRSGKVKRVLLEAGCGVGNTLFPLINENTDIFVHACDFSPRAIDFVKVRLVSSTSSEVLEDRDLLMLNNSYLGNYLLTVGVAT